MSFLNRIKDRKGLLGSGVRGGAWLMAGSAGEQGFRFLRNLILARLLAPEAFGLMALVLSSCSLAQVLTAIGVREAVIQNPQGAERTYLNGVWWISIARGLLVCAGAYVAAPFLAAFYEDQALTPLLRVAFLSMLVMGALSPRAYVALKEMQYRNWAVVQNAGGMLGVATTITLGFMMPGVWALVIGYVAESVFRVLLSFMVCPFRPGLQFDREHLRALWRYTSGLLGLPLLTLIYSEASVFVVGKMCTKEQLGMFALVLALGRNPSGLLMEPLRGVLMPTFAALQNQDERLSLALLQITRAIVLPTMAVAAFVVMNGSGILGAVYGTRYSAGASVLAVLVLCEVLAIANLPLTAVFLAGGKPQLQRRFAVIRALATIVFLYPLVRSLGLLGAALAPALALAVAYGFQLARIREVMKLDLRVYGGVFLRGLLLTLPALGAWFLSWPLTHGTDALMATTISVAVAAMCYLATVGVMAWRGVLRQWIWPQLNPVREQ